MRRVVVTGLGIVSPLGCGIEPVWKRLVSGASGIKPIEHFDASDLGSRIAGIVPRTDGRAGGGDDPHAFDPDAVMSPREQKRIDEFILYGIAAADEALSDSGWQPTSDEVAERAGVLIGSGTGGLNTIYETSLLLNEKGPRRVSPFVIPGIIINLISGQVSIRHGLKGPRCCYRLFDGRACDWRRCTHDQVRRCGHDGRWRIRSGHRAARRCELRRRACHVHRF